jgi:hypothetical protein
MTHSGAHIARSGMTLIETLIAIGLLVFLAGSMMVFISDVRTQRAILADLSADLQATSTLFERIERDLALCMAYDPERQSSGVRGDARSLSLVARRVWLDLDEPARGMSGTARSTYRFDPDTHTITIEADGRSATLTDRVEALRFRFNTTGSPDTWSESFDAISAGGLPVAIEVAVWFLPPGSERPRDEQAMFEDELDTAAASDRAGAVAERDAALSRPDGAADLPMREPDRWRIFALPDAEPTEGRAALLREAGSGGGAP